MSHSSAWECRDQFDQAEIYYNAPLRARNRQLQKENLNLKRLLRENGIQWQHPSSRVTRAQSVPRLPHLPTEIQLRILSYALTSPDPIVDPLSRARPDRMLAREKDHRKNTIAIHFLATCKAYHVEGSAFLWRNNTFIFTSPEAVKRFAEVDLTYREKVHQVQFRIIARYYDDEPTHSHKLSSSYHPDIKRRQRMPVQRRNKEPTLARRGFRVYGWYQLVDFLEALLPPYDPSQAKAHNMLLEDSRSATTSDLSPRTRLLPCLEQLRIDFVNFGEEMLQFPPPQLHDLASHHLGCYLNEVILTGLPSDDCGFRVSTELGGLVKDEGLIIDHAPTMVALKRGIRELPCDDDECHYSSKIIRGMRNNPHMHDEDHHRHDDDDDDFPAAPPDEGEPPESSFHSCRTIWKKIPVQLGRTDERKWVLFDRVSGMPWEDVEDEVTMFDTIDEDDEGMICDNCGEIHPGAIPPDDMMSLYDDM